MDTFAELTSAAHQGAAGIGSGQIITAEQARASNYKKGRVKLHGFDIAIETPAGQRRTGKSDGQPWSVICMAHYGDITGTKASDGDPLDVFIGPWPESERVYVVNRVNPDGAFDEVKILMGFPNVESALTAYKNSYERGAHGLSSYVPCSIDQLKWWIKFGDTTKPITTKSLPHDGSVDMNETAWDSNAMPVGTDLPGLMYKMRRDDMGDNLLLDSVSVADILEDSDGELALDALVVPYNKLERKMTQMQMVMKATGDTVKPVAMQVTPPFKQRGTTNVAVVYELSDGQTVSVYFHNPDSTPNRITPDDEMVSWKWLLNKKDITILVAPEHGKDLNPREVARRIMRIAERNSARFQAANTKRAERMAAIESTKQLVTSQEEQLQGLYAEIDSLEAKVEAKRSTVAAPIAEPVVVAAPAVLQGEIHDQDGAAIAGTSGEPTIAPAEAPAVVEPQADTGREPFKAGERVYIKPEFQDRGDELFVRVAVDDEDGGRLMVRTIGTGISVAGGPIAVMEADMLERRTPAEQEAVELQKGILSAEGYAIAQRLPSLLELHQDTLDSFFQERLVAVRNAMRELEWFGLDKVMTKGDYRFTFDVATVGAGSNIVGIKYQIMDGKEIEVSAVLDDLSKTPEEIAKELNRAQYDAMMAEAAPSLEVRMTRAAQGYDLATGFDEIQAIVDEAKAIGRDELVMVLATLQNFNQPIYGKYQGFVVGDRAEWSMTAPEFADFILSGSSAADPDAEVVAAAVEAAKRGAGGITKILTGQYFTFDFEGEDPILTDELRAKVEAALGAKLVEKVFPGFEGEVALVPEEAAPSAEDKVAEGKSVVNGILAKIGATNDGWVRSPSALGVWEYTNATKGDTTARIGVSGGGVVSVDGRSHDPAGKLNSDPEAAERSIVAVLGAPVVDSTGDTAFLQSVIDGKEDMLAADFADRLTALYDKYESDPAMMALFEKAAEAYSSYMVDEARRTMG